MYSNQSSQWAFELVNIMAVDFNTDMKDLPVNKQHISHPTSFKMIVQLLVHFLQQQPDIFWEQNKNEFTNCVEISVLFWNYYDGQLKRGNSQSLQADSHLSRARERRRAKRSSGKVSGEGAPLSRLTASPRAFVCQPEPTRSLNLIRQTYDSCRDKGDQNEIIYTYM